MSRVDVDVVVVSYNSRGGLRACVEPLSRMPSVRVIVADNASADDSLGSISDLPVTRIANPRNGGFSYGVNAAWRAGRAPLVLILNPDAAIGERDLRTLEGRLTADERLAAVAPRITNADGSLQFSLRRFPRLRSTFAYAIFLHRLFPRASWTDEVIRDPAAYATPGRPEWVSGACLLVRRSVLERLGGLDEGFFLYSEDKDLCRRVHQLGLGIAYEPSARCSHVGGVSAPRSGLLPVLAASRIRYSAKHSGRPGALAERLGVALGATTHALAAARDAPKRRGHLRALRVALTGWDPSPSVAGTPRRRS